VLAVAEIALAFVLAVAASLLVRELLQLRATDLGMVTDHVVTVHLGRRLPVSEGEHPEDGFVRRFYEIEARAAALPGVRAAGVTQMLPLQNWGWFSNSIDFFEVGGAPLAEVFPIELRYVTPGYFRALGIRVVRGRGFSGAETRATPAVIIINEALARAQFGSADPVGRRMNRGTIIGVIADVRGVHPGRPPQPEIYFPAAQNWSELLELGMTLAVSTTGPPDAVVGAVRSIVHDVDPQFAVFEIKTMDRIVEDSLSLFRLFVGLIVGFAVVAVALALTGTYGVVSCVTTSRLREFAVRMALGADARRITATVVRHGTWLTAIGLAAGTLLVYVAAPLLRQSPISVRPPEGRLVILLAAGLAAITLAACLLPARRAARVDPMSVLRAD
jgi:predicted permease